jgi:hypothetical protein
MKNRTKYLAKLKLLSSHNYVINTLLKADLQFKMDTISENNNLALTSASSNKTLNTGNIASMSTFQCWKKQMNIHITLCTCCKQDEKFV